MKLICLTICCLLAPAAGSLIAQIAQPGQPVVNALAVPPAQCANLPDGASEKDFSVVAAPKGAFALNDPVKAALDGLKDEKKFAAAAETLLDATIGRDDPTRKLKDFHALIHVVELATGGGEDEVKAKSDRWLVYRSGITFEESTGTRVLGSRNVVVLFFHINAMGGAFALTQAQRDELVECSLSDSKGQKFRQIGEIGGKPVVVQRRFADVQYEVKLVRKTPANVQSLQSILRVFDIVAQGKEGTIGLVSTPIILWGGGSIQNIRLPADITVAGYALTKDKPKQRIGGQVVIDNEGKYMWDVSVGIPVHKIKELEYSATDNVVRAKEVTKQSAYAMLNLFFPIDIKDPKSNLMPRLLVGLPFSERPWDKLFLGAGIGIPKLTMSGQFYAGVVFNHVKAPANLSAGETATENKLQSDLKTRIQYKFVVGINVPVKSVIDKLLK